MSCLIFMEQTMPLLFMLYLMCSMPEQKPVAAPMLPGLGQLEPLDIPAMRAKMRAMPPADPNED